MSELQHITEVHNPTIIGVTESWITPEMLDSEVNIPGMTLFRGDRRDRPGGGSILYVKSHVPARPINHPAMNLIPDSLFCEMTPNNTCRVLVGLIYRSPCSTREDNERLFEAIRTFAGLRYTNLLIMGDFNLPNARFDQWDAPDTSCPTANLINITEELHLTQHVNGPTRLGSDGLGSRLDLIFTNEPLMVDQVVHLPPLGNSDHVMLLFTFICDVVIDQSTVRPRPNFFRAD